uniref:Uncharacterized protein n=1 Tax=viral metagenome TaxID=1070528 RepID=A0A6M3IP31_9ZZZZ
MILGIMLGISGYWASYVTEGAQKAVINETKLTGLSKDIDIMKVDLKADLRLISTKLDKLNDMIIKTNFTKP